MPSLAQDTGAQSAPVQISPDQLPPAETPLPEPAPARPPGSLAPIAPVAVPEAGTPEAEGLPDLAGEEIMVQRLEDVDPSAVGTLREETGGFPADMWAGTPRALVGRLLPEIPADTGSSTLRRLTRRLLLTAAAVPEGAGGDLLGLKIERLVAIGDMEAVRDLIALLPGGAPEPALAILEANAHLLARDTANACALGSRMARRETDPYWFKLQVFCRILRDEMPAAVLGVDLLREQGIDDAAFFTLAAVLMGIRDGGLDSLPAPTPLHLAMLAASGLPVPPDALSGARPALLRNLATAPNASADFRIVAAEEAARRGLVGIEVIRQIYASFPFTEDERRAARSALARAYEPRSAEREARPASGIVPQQHVLDGPRGRALLYQIALAEEEAGPRLQTLRVLWRRGRADGLYGTVAAATAAALAAVEPEDVHLAAAADVIRALVTTSNLARAYDWYELVGRAARRRDETALRAFRETFPIMQIADGGRRYPWNPDAARFWFIGLEGARAEEGPEACARVRETAGLAFTLAEGLGHGVAPSVWRALLAPPLRQPGDLPAYALWRGLEAATSDGRLAETVLLALVAVGPEGLRDGHPAVLAAAVGALARAGLDGEARALAAEILAARTGREP